MTLLLPLLGFVFVSMLIAGTAMALSPGAGAIVERRLDEIAASQAKPDSTIKSYGESLVRALKRVGEAAPQSATERLSGAHASQKAYSDGVKTGQAGPKATAGFEQLRQAQQVTEIVREQSDYYHATKTLIFNALLNTIDLAQLAQLDPKAASEEIRDIVAELVAIKNVSMSVAEQEHLVQDIINDVLGYGPLEPLLARDDIADIMVNGANRVFIEVRSEEHTSELQSH